MHASTLEYSWRLYRDRENFNIPAFEFQVLLSVSTHQRLKAVLDIINSFNILGNVHLLVERFSREL
jgi:hypothetical protein